MSNSQKGGEQYRNKYVIYTSYNTKKQNMVDLKKRVFSHNTRKGKKRETGHLMYVPLFHEYLLR